MPYKYDVQILSAMKKLHTFHNKKKHGLYKESVSVSLTPLGFFSPYYLHFATLPILSRDLAWPSFARRAFPPQKERSAHGSLRARSLARTHAPDAPPKTHALFDARSVCFRRSSIDRDVDSDPDDRRERNAHGGGSFAPHEDRVPAREDPRHLRREARATETLLPGKTGTIRFVFTRGFGACATVPNGLKTDPDSARKLPASELARDPLEHINNVRACECV